MTLTPFTRGTHFGLLEGRSANLLHLAGKVARAARRLPPSAAFSSSWAAQLPRPAFVLAGAFTPGDA